MRSLFALGLAIQPLAAGQQAAQTKEIILKAEQWDEEIAAWQEQLAEIDKNLSDPTKIWVYLRDAGTVATDDLELVRAIRENAILRLIRLAEDSRLLGFRDLRLEDKSAFREEVEASVKETYAELVKQDKAIREIKKQQAERLREIIRGLEKKRADALAAKSQQTGTPQFRPDEADVAETEKEAVRIALGPTAKEENWDTRDIDYVVSYLRKTKTPAQLRLVKKLIENFSGCYKAWNTEKARIVEAAKAGNWMPGKRIGAFDEALGDRNACLKRHKDSFEDVW